MSLSKPAGGFRLRKTPSEIKLEDIWLPWNFCRVLDREPLKVHKWLRSEGLLAAEMVCSKCKTPMKLNVRSKDAEGYRWRCQTNRGHEASVKEFSFFQGGRTPIQVSKNYFLFQSVQFSLPNWPNTTL